MKYIMSLLALVCLGAGCEGPPCLSGHMETRHQEAYSSIAYNGYIHYTVHHPEQDYEVFICDEYVPE